MKIKKLTKKQKLILKVFIKDLTKKQIETKNIWRSIRKTKSREENWEPGCRVFNKKSRD